MGMALTTSVHQAFPQGQALPTHDIFQQNALHHQRHGSLFRLEGVGGTSVATARERSRRLPNQDMADAGSICKKARYTAAASFSQSSSFSGMPAAI